ncbi:MAG: hypothetical protein JXA90_01020, partial [Planctomycetes bacterium]|nr:hypothetical protein [Planctomycetota bacterium]
DGEFGGEVLQVALKAASRCHEITGGKNWMYLDTLALAKFKSGARKEALELQRRAVEMGKEEKVVERMLKEALERLAEFEKAAEESAPVRL